MAANDYTNWIKLALKEAEKAFSENEIPVGAVLVRDNTLISSNHNRTGQLNDPTAHAEKLLIEQIIKQGDKYLSNYTLYVTLEPCSMCAGMMVLTKLGKLVYGAHDPKSGASGSIYNIPLDKQLNHNFEIVGGILAEECGRLLKEFFQNRR